MDPNVKNIADRLKKRFIFLSGFMGTGKSAAGSKLAKRLKIPFYDVDENIIEMRKVSIAEIFTFEGEESFRDYESEALEEIIQKGGPAVVSLGGGALLRKKNNELVQASGIVISLKADPDSILERLGESQIISLFIMCGKSPVEMDSREKVLEAIIKLNERRKTVYDNADFSVFSGGKTTDEVIDEILRKIGRFK